MFQACLLHEIGGCLDDPFFERWQTSPPTLYVSSRLSANFQWGRVKESEPLLPLPPAELNPLRGKTKRGTFRAVCA